MPDISPTPSATEARDAAESRRWDELDAETQTHLVERCVEEMGDLDFALRQSVTDYTDESDADRLNQTVGVLQILFDAHQRQSTVLASLRAERAADTERLDWLDKHGHGEGEWDEHWLKFAFTTSSRGLSTATVRTFSIRDHIDAARAATPETATNG